MSAIVIVGSGAAGLTAALTATSLGHKVTLVTKHTLGESNTRYAQGGIAAVTDPDDSIDSHIADTIAAGAGLADPDFVRILCTEGPARIQDLLALGTEFDRASDGAPARGLEAAHSAARVLHAGGDATGRAIIAALTRAVRASGVSVREFAFARDLAVGGGRVTGIHLLEDGRESLLPADAVIIATGGAGQLYAHTSNPAGATGDGVAAARRAGARLIDAEFVQFHPTTLAVPGTPLISEAVRGEGAVLLDAAGERFMRSEHPDAELAPRDVVARAIARQMRLQGGAPVLLDARGVGAATLKRRFPGFTSLAAQHGLDPATNPVPVTPAAHYWMGGIEVDTHGRTALPGLFAVGEAACTRVHGANRLASNSLLEALVTGYRGAHAIDSDWPASDPVLAAPADGTEPITRAEIQRIMWERVGLERDADGLAAAGELLAAATAPIRPEDLIYDHETVNLLQLARDIVAAASARTESIGAHHRSDAAIVTASHREVTIAC